MLVVTEAKTMKVRLYTRESISDFDEVAHPHAPFLRALLLRDSTRWLENVHCEILAIGNESGCVPIVIPFKHSDNCYTCNFRAQYIDYPLVLIRRDWGWSASLLVYPIFAALRIILTLSRAEKVVFVDNWLLSTNLHGKWLEEHLCEVVSLLQETYPQHTLVIRSVNPEFDETLLGIGERNGFQRLLSRPIYLIGTSTKKLDLFKDHRRDQKLLSNTKLSIRKQQSISPDEAKRCIDLYNSLYLVKYTSLNPQLTQDWLIAAVETGFLSLQTLRDQEEIVGTVGYYKLEGTMTAPLLGYDTVVRTRPSIYRLLTALISREGLSKGMRMNRSAGADDFKLNRGAKPVLEYSLVLPAPSTKRCWGLFIWMVNLATESFRKRGEDASKEPAPAL